MSDKRLPLSVPVLGGNEWTYVKDCLDTSWVSSAGAYVERLEQAICSLAGVPYAVALVNGTSALHLALLVAGVRPGDKVIVPTVTFIATANAVRHAGADPIFVDCDEFMNIDPTGVRSFLEECCVAGADGTCREQASGAVVRAILPVHVYGRPADIARLLPLASDYGLTVIEDASEALGSSWSEGPLASRSVGTVSHGGVFSFNGNKIVTCGGGGMYVTADAAAAGRVRHLSTQAKTDAVRFVHDDAGWNYRLTNVAAAIGVAQLEQLPRFMAAKQESHRLYAELLSDIPGIELIGVQPGTVSNCWFHSIVIDEKIYGRDREGLMQALTHEGIETRPLWGLLHEQEPYRGCTSWRITRAPWFWRRVLNLPCSSDLTATDVEQVATAIARARVAI